MAEQYSRNNLRHVVAVICQSIGWRGIRSTPFEVLIDILERYLKNIGRLTHLFSEQFGRTVPNIDDVGLAFDVAGINLRELSEYIQAVGQIPCKNSVSQFPIPKPTSQQVPQHLSFFNNWAQTDECDETDDAEQESLHLLPPAPLSDTDENKNFLKRNGDIGQTAVAIPPITLDGIEELRPDDGVSTTACSVVAMAESGVLSSTRDGQQPLARKPPSPPHTAPTSSNHKKSVTGSKNEESKHKNRKKKKKKKSDKENNHTKPKKLKTLIGLNKHKAIADKVVSSVKTEHIDHSNGLSKKIICKSSSMECAHEMKETNSTKSQINNVPETSRLSSDLLQSCSSKEGNVPIAVRINKSVVSTSVSCSGVNIGVKNNSDFHVISETSIKKKDSGNSKVVNAKKESFKQSSNFVDTKENLQDLFKPDIYKSTGHGEKSTPKLDSGQMNGHISPKITIPSDIKAKEVENSTYNQQEAIKDNVHKECVNGKIFKNSEENSSSDRKSVSLKTNHISVKKENESVSVKQDTVKLHIKKESSATNIDPSLVSNSRFRASLIYSSSDSEVDIESIDTRIEHLSPPHICKTPSPVGWGDSPPPQRPRTPDITPSAIKHTKKKKKRKHRKEEKESLPFDSEICHSPLPIRPPTPNIFLHDVCMTEETSLINKEEVVLREELTKSKSPETVNKMTYQTPDHPPQSHSIIQTSESKKHKSKKKKKHKDSSPSKHKLKKKKEKSSDAYGSVLDKQLKINTDVNSDRLKILNAVKHKWEEKFQAKKEEPTQESSKSSLLVTPSLKLTVPIPPIKKPSPTLPITRLPVVPDASPVVPFRTPVTGSRKRKATTPSSHSSKKKKKVALNEQYNSNIVTPQTVVEKNLDSKKLTAPLTEDEPIGFYFDETGNRVWVCPTCKGQDDGRPMIRCDDCYAWYHWACVGITTAPDENIDWFCSYCFKKKDGVRHRKKKSKKPKD